LENTVGKPLSNLIINPTTIGEKLKNRRLELGLLQIDVANIIGVCEDSITGWENNRNEPSIMYYPKIIQFLGYVPFEVDDSTLGGQIKLYRYLHGLSQEELARILDINESTVFHYENNKHKPSPKTLRKIKSLLYRKSNLISSCNR
jgi:transcriptional regulator with XRE-family HTH domain